jgi:hypothetical protein
MLDASRIMVTTLAPAGQLAASCTTQWDTIRRTKRHVFKRLPCRDGGGLADTGQ